MNPIAVFAVKVGLAPLGMDDHLQPLEAELATAVVRQPTRVRACPLQQRIGKWSHSQLALHQLEVKAFVLERADENRACEFAFVEDNLMVKAVTPFSSHAGSVELACARCLKSLTASSKIKGVTRDSLV